jgi:hypothetical protein
MQKRVRKVQHRLYTTMVMVLANFGAVFLTMLVLYLVGRVDILLLIPMACTVLLTSAALFAVLWLDARDTLAITEEELFVKRYVEEDLRKRGYDTLTLWRELSRRKFGTRR